MSQLTVQRWQRLMDLFDLMWTAPPLDREAVVWQFCPDDREVRTKALLMAKALDDDPDFMEHGPA